MPSPHKAARYHEKVAVLLLDVFLLFVFINLLIAGSLWLFERFGSDPVTARYGEWRVERVYPDLGRQEARELLREMWSRPFVYEPFTGFKGGAFKGKYINVDAHGFRVTKNQGPWPPNRGADFVVFFFGGSTALARGLPDDETPASYLQDRLATEGIKRTPRVYNFGRESYYSTQEAVLYMRLLQSGFVPDAAVFLDGLNEYFNLEDKPRFSDQFEKLMDERQATGYLVRRLAHELPAVEMVDWVQLHTRFKELTPPPGPEQKPDGPAVAKRIADRYMQNKKVIEALSAAYGARPLFVWQPIPVYRADPSVDLFAVRGFGPLSYHAYGYALMSEYAQQDQPNFAWCANIQEGIKAPLYVDFIHYNARLSKMVAACIAENLAKRGSLQAGSADLRF